MTFPRAILASTCLALATLAGVGCASARLDPRAARAAAVGRFGPVAAKLSESLPADPSNREYLLARLNVLQMTLAEGLPDAGEETANELFALLRTQGLNADNTTASIVLNEGLKVWKGEPFEQAFAYHAICMQKAMRGEWDNARAAAQSSLFLLKDFSESVGRDATTADLATAAARADQRSPGAGDALLDTGYAPARSDFALGYLMNAVANRALGREDEARDNFAAAAGVDPSLTDLARAFQGTSFNTVLVVEYGFGPEKRAEGPDGALSVWHPRTASTNAPLRAFVRPVGTSPASDRGLGAFPVVQDANAMSRSLRWNNLEDIRTLKSALGDALLAGGIIVASTGDDKKNDDARWIGLAMAALGLAMKGTAHADTRHAELLPQRVYMVPLALPPGQSVVTLDVEGTRVTLTDLAPPGTSPVQLRCVRVPSSAGAWASTPTLTYANEYSRQPIPGDDLPFIFGGRDASRPSPDVMERYRRAGNLASLTQVDLENLYREEGITLAVEDQQGRMRRHVLDGGDSLVPPLPGTMGYQRLFGQQHETYQPRSGALKDAIAEERRSGGGNAEKEQMPNQ
jgi:hypothetical protein